MKCDCCGGSGKIRHHGDWDPLETGGNCRGVNQGRPDWFSTCHLCDGKGYREDYPAPAQSSSSGCLIFIVSGLGAIAYAIFA